MTRRTPAFQAFRVPGVGARAHARARERQRVQTRNPWQLYQLLKHEK